MWVSLVHFLLYLSESFKGGSVTYSKVFYELKHFSRICTILVLSIKSNSISKDESSAENPPYFWIVIPNRICGCTLIWLWIWVSCSSNVDHWKVFFLDELNLITAILNQPSITFLSIRIYRKIWNFTA